MSRPSQKPSAPRSQQPDEILDPRQPAPDPAEHPQPGQEQSPAPGAQRLDAPVEMTLSAAEFDGQAAGAPHTAEPLEQPALPRQEPVAASGITFPTVTLASGGTATLAPSAAPFLGVGVGGGVPLHPADRAHLDRVIQRELQAATDRWNASTGPTPIVGGALFDFLGYLTSLEKGVTVGAKHNATTVLDHLRAWADQRGLDLDKAQVGTWHDALPRVPRQAGTAQPPDEADAEASRDPLPGPATGTLLNPRPPPSTAAARHRDRQAAEDEAHEELDDEGDSGDDEGREPSTRNQATTARQRPRGHSS